MESRQEQLAELRNFIKEAENEVTLILQTLQWDKSSLIQAGKADEMVTCKYDSNHRVPAKTQKNHEEKCFLKAQGYKSDDLFLPEPLDLDAKTLVKFTSDEIKQIIDSASKNDPLFKRGNGSVDSEPLTLERLAATYTADERRAIHDAVVNTMPSFHDLSDLALPSSSDASASKPKSRLEVLAELRDMRRRRARYRGAAPANNYSHTLRELIATQMELYTGSNMEVKIEQSDQKSNKARIDTHRHDMTHDDRQKRERHKDSYARDKYSKGNMRENFRDRENYNIRDDKEKYSNKDGRYDIKRERESSYSKERDRRHSRHDDRKRWERHDSYSDDRSFSNDRKRYENERDGQYRERKEEKYRKVQKVEHTRYYDYDSYEKSGRHASKEKSKSRDYR